MRIGLSQFFGLFTALALIIGFAVLVIQTRDLRMTVLAIVCLVLFSWLMPSRSAQ
jgi:hypothetical protein